MPQAIAMQLLTTAPAMPASAVALAPTAAVAGKVPKFAGLLAQLGRSALPSILSAAQPPAAKAPDPVAKAQEQTAGAGTQGTQPEAAGASLTPRPPVMPEPALPSILPSLPVPASAPTFRPRSAAAAHDGAAREPLAAASVNEPAAGAAAAPAVTPVPAMPVPTAIAATTNPPQQLPQPAPACGQGGRTSLAGVAAKPGAAASGPQAGIASAQPGTTAETPATTSSAAAASAALPGATAAPPPDTATSLLGGAQPLQIAGAAQLPGIGPAPIAATGATQPDTTAAPPAQQVSAALVSLAGTPGNPQHMTLRLEPAALGQVQIRIDRPTDAPAQVDITVQRPETLTLLLRDQPQLQRALDLAGVPADGRSLTMHVAAPESTATSGGATSGAAGGADPGPGGGNGAGPGSGGQGQSADAADQDQDDSATPLPRWLRAGLDITA